MRILITTPDANIRKGFIRILEANGHTADEAANPDALRHQLRSNRYDSILLDEKLPPLKPDALVKLIRTFPAHGTTRIVAVGTMKESFNAAGDPNFEFSKKEFENRVWKTGRILYLLLPKAT